MERLLFMRVRVRQWLKRKAVLVADPIQACLAAIRAIPGSEEQFCFRQLRERVVANPVTNSELQPASTASLLRLVNILERRGLIRRVPARFPTPRWRVI